MRVEGDLRERERKKGVAGMAAKWSLESAPSTDSIAPHRHSLQLSYCSLRDPEAGWRESSAGGLLSSLVPNCVSVFPSFRGKAPAASFWPSPRQRPLLAISPPPRPSPLCSTSCSLRRRIRLLLRIKFLELGPSVEVETEIKENVAFYHPPSFGFCARAFYFAIPPSCLLLRCGMFLRQIICFLCPALVKIFPLLRPLNPSPTTTYVCTTTTFFRCSILGNAASAPPPPALYVRYFFLRARNSHQRTQSGVDEGGEQRTEGWKRQQQLERMEVCML